MVVRPAAAPCGPPTVWLERAPRPTVAVSGPGWNGSIYSRATRIDGLLAAADVADALRGEDVLRPGGDADLDRLAARLARAHHRRAAGRVALGVIMIALVLVAPRRALMTGPAAIAAALVLSAFGSTSVSLLALLTLVGSFAPVGALWAFFAAYLAVLVVSPETQSLALLGPHPLNGGRFYGLTNETETLLLAPALLLGLRAAPLVLVTVAWSRAGADGGGAIVFLAAYALLLPRPSNKVLLGYAAAAVAAAVALVGLDAATGGHSHVTKTVGDGPGAVWHSLTHRWSGSWHGATANPVRVLLVLACLGGLVWVATRAPRDRLVDAFLVGIAVSLVVNDTPQDVVMWGSLQAIALRRAV